GDMGFTGTFIVLLRAFPVRILDREAAGVGQGRSLVSALPIDRNPVGGFDREYGHVGLLKCESPARWPGYAVGMVLGALDQAASRSGAGRRSSGRTPDRANLL